MCAWEYTTQAGVCGNAVELSEALRDGGLVNMSAFKSLPGHPKIPSRVYTEKLKISFPELLINFSGRFLDVTNKCLGCKHTYMTVMVLRRLHPVPYR